MKDIFKPRVNILPYEYPQLLEYKDAIRHSYWIDTEFNFTEDIQDFKININSEEKDVIKKNNKIQTLGISKSNIEFFNEHILDITKFLWNINKIEIFSENLRNEKILNFQNGKENLFAIIRNYDLYNYLFLNLNKNRLI